MRIYRIPKIVQRMFPSILWSFPNEKSSVFLTFDDGPHEKFTPQIIDILEKQNAKATFFLLGNLIKGNEDLIRRMNDAGHAIGIHGYEHVSLLSKSKNDFRKQILRAKDELESVIGNPINLFRPPFGRFNLRMLKVCRELDVQLVLWSLMTYDFDARISDEKLVNIFQNKVRGGDIVVLHDGGRESKRTVAVSGEMVRVARSKGKEPGTIQLKQIY